MPSTQPLASPSSSTGYGVTAASGESFATTVGTSIGARGLHAVRYHFAQLKRHDGDLIAAELIRLGVPSIA